MTTEPRRWAVITGASSGIGAALAPALAREGWDLVLVNRSAARSSDVVRAVAAARPGAAAEVVEADLADLDSIRDATATVRKAHPRLGALFNNAGVLLGSAAYSRHGVEMHAQVNVLAPYALTRLLAPALGGAVVVNTGSDVSSRLTHIDIAELAKPTTKFVRLFGSYGLSKLALTTMTAALAPQLPEMVLRIVEPGAVKTPMTRGSGMPVWLRPIRDVAFAQPETGAARLRDGAFSSYLKGRTGVYIEKGRLKALPAAAADPATQAAVLDWCREVTAIP